MNSKIILDDFEKASNIMERIRTYFVSREAYLVYYIWTLDIGYSVF